MVDTKKEQERDELHRAIWAIADELRGAVDGWDFKNYVLGTMFYRYISENLCNYINSGEIDAGNTDFDYAKMPDEDAEEAREGLVEEKGFFILPSELFCNVRTNAANDENLNETLERVFRHIEESAKGSEAESDFAGLFDDYDVNSNKLGSTVAKRNEKLVKLLNGVGEMNLGDVKDIIQKDFASADGEGYIVLPPQVLHAGNYGVPEMRERVIFIGIRKDALKPEALKALSSQQVPREYDPYPIPTHSATVRGSNLMGIVTTQDVLEGLKEPENTIDASQQLYSKAKFLATGQGQTEIKLDNLGPTIRSEHHGNIEFRRLSLEHGGKHFDELNAGLQERRLTPRECALIQTFPPDYRFVMKKANGRGYRLSSSGAYKVIGNAVPPVLAFNIAMRLQEVWDEYFVPTD